MAKTLKSFGHSEGNSVKRLQCQVQNLVNHNLHAVIYPYIKRKSDTISFLLYSCKPRQPKLDVNMHFTEIIEFSTDF